METKTGTRTETKTEKVVNVNSIGRQDIRAKDAKVVKDKEHAWSGGSFNVLDNKCG